MKPYVDALVREALSDAIEAGLLRTRSMPDFRVDPPRYAAFGDLACDVALVLGRELSQPPRTLAALVAGCLRDRRGWLAGVEVGGPGFVNFRFAPAFWRARLEDALAAGRSYGRTGSGRGRRVRVEVVRHDPGGEPSVGDGRVAAVAGAAARVLEAAGCDVERSGRVPGFAATAGVAGPGVADGGPPGEVVDEVVTVVGAEHAGAAAGRAPAKRRRVVAVHPVRLTRDGEPVRADVPLHAVLGEVGHDAARFLLLLERADRHVDLDLELAKRERTANPVFHVQYAAARLGGVLRRADEDAVHADLTGLGDADADALRAVAAWPDVVELAARAVEPHRIAAHAMELATVVHRWANRTRMVRENRAPAPERLALARSMRHILGSALAICGVSAPERM